MFKPLHNPAPQMWCLQDLEHQHEKKVVVWFWPQIILAAVPLVLPRHGDSRTVVCSALLTLSCFSLQDSGRAAFIHRGHESWRLKRDTLHIRPASPELDGLTPGNETSTRIALHVGINRRADTADVRKKHTSDGGHTAHTSYCCQLVLIFSSWL